MTNLDHEASASDCTSGLTKREYMAIHFMAAMLANPSLESLTDESLALFARTTTNALVKELNKETPPCK